MKGSVWQSPVEAGRICAPAFFFETRWHQKQRLRLCRNGPSCYRRFQKKSSALVTVKQISSSFTAPVGSSRAIRHVITRFPATGDTWQSGLIFRTLPSAK